MKKLLVITLCIITLVFSACSGNNEKFEAKLSEQKEVSKVKLTLSGTMLILFRHM